MDTQTKKKRGRPWLWGTIIIYCLFASSTLGFVFFASSQKVDLVSEDYYKQELQYQYHIETVKRTGVDEKKVKWKVETDGSSISFRLPASAQGTITFYRPSSSSLDKSFMISPDVDGVQKIRLQGLASGLWKVKIAWKVESISYYDEMNVII